MCTYRGWRLEGLGVPKERGLVVICLPLVSLLRGQQSVLRPHPFQVLLEAGGFYVSLSPPSEPLLQALTTPLPQTVRANSPQEGLCRHWGCGH